MDIKTVVLAIPISMIVRHLATRVLTKIITRWGPALRGILPGTLPKEK